MPKNIVICSDGTGNSGSKANGTNVWRTYQAIDRENETIKQIAYYDDGVGTEDFKLLKAMGSGLGWGITRNLEQLYGFLIREFEPGDQIYMFGFSRGAFTVRTLANILYYCGIADCDNEDGSPKSPKELDDIASNAIRAYKRRDFRNPDNPQSPACQFRQEFGRSNPQRDVMKWKGRFEIRFLGAWDTVDAVGLPFDELTTAFAEMPGIRNVFGLTLHRPGETYLPEWENDLNLVQNAAHAIALDDERKTFHPTMMIEKPTFLDRQGRATAIDQVWFAGMHSNVGGGYLKDEMALVPLKWMLEKARQANPQQPLRILRSLEDEYARDADSEGKLYDSRAGHAVNYRYAPRDVGRFMEQVSDEIPARSPRIHESVFERIKSRVEDYAPISIPETFDVEPSTSTLRTSAMSQAATRRDWHDATAGPILIRQVLYYFQLIQTLLLLLVLPSAQWLDGFWLAKWDPRCCSYAWLVAVGLGLCRVLHSAYDRRKDVKKVLPAADDWWSDFGASSLKFVENAGFVALALMLFQNTLLALAAVMIPEAAKGYLTFFDQHPFLLFCFVLTFYSILDSTLSAQRAIRELSVHAWAITFETTTATSLSGFSKWISSFVRRSSKYVRGISAWVNRRALPFISLVDITLLLVYVLLRSWSNATECSSTETCCPTTVHLLDDEPTTVEFSTKDANFPTGFGVTKGKHYRITVKPRSSAPQAGETPTESWNWKDASYEATPEGLKHTDWKMTLLMPARRVQNEPWFKFMASIHDDHQAFIIPVGTETAFEAPATGELHLFVNDASPCLGPCCYANNQGTASVMITEVADTKKNKKGLNSVPNQ